MLHKVLFSALLASLIGSSLLTGCASNFERFYKPAVTAYGSAVTPTAAPPLTRSRDPVLLWSRDLNGDGKRLALEGYALIGTSSYNGALDLTYLEDAVAQGKKVGAVVVLLRVDFSRDQDVMAVSDDGRLKEYGPGVDGIPSVVAGSVSYCRPQSQPTWGGNTSACPRFGHAAIATVFASYWAKANAP